MDDTWQMKINKQQGDNKKDDNSSANAPSRGRGNDRSQVNQAPPENRRTVSRPPTSERRRVSRPPAPTRFGSVNQAPSTERVSVPRANFRGSQASREVRTINPESRRQTRQNLSGWLRERNSRTGSATRVTIQAGTPTLNRATNDRVRSSYRRVERDLGRPTHRYLLRPRYYDTDNRHRRDRDRSFVVSFFYPFYFAGTTGYYAGLYPSIYDYWGWTPAYVYPDRVYYDPSDYIYAVPYDSGYNLDNAGVRRTLNDIRLAWLNSDINALTNHLTDQVDVRVYFDNNYRYTTSTEDFYGMTADTMATVRTVGLRFGQPVWLSPNEVFVTGRHTFLDPEGYRHTVYLSYRLRRLGYDWFIVAAGSSRRPIPVPYTSMTIR